MVCTVDGPWEKIYFLVCARRIFEEKPMSIGTIVNCKLFYDRTDLVDIMVNNNSVYHNNRNINHKHALHTYCNKLFIALNYFTA